MARFLFKHGTSYANLMDFEGCIFVIIIEGMINIKKHKIKVPIFNSRIDKPSILTGTSET
ncbi:MAG: hypothetical protein JKY02_08790 [Flavobacteriaceae bacterium]|nr:hypothetical protein [Flavobacteriaceae bacterium]